MTYPPHDPTPEFDAEDLSELGGTLVRESIVQSLPDTEASLDADDDSAADLDLTNQGTMYLVKQRIENLREQIGASAEEVLELQELEKLMKPYEDDRAALPEGLGIPSKTDQFIAALEGKRVNRYADSEYDGGEVDEDDEMSESSVNQWYQKLLKQSRLNLKSIALLSTDRKPLYHQHGKARPVTLFDLYETLPPKYTFEKFLAKLYQMTEEQALATFQKISEPDQYAVQQQWQSYLEDRKLRAPSPFQKLLLRCQDFVTSPIYDGMTELKDEHYQLTNGVEFRFTDKTIVFTIPFTEVEDIPKKPTILETPEFLEVAFILPEYAHDRKRFFKKNGTVAEFCLYLQHLGVELSEKQTQFLNNLATSGSLRLYHEILELPDRNEIRGYFLNIPKSYAAYPPLWLRKCIRERLKQEDRINVHQVTNFSTQFPEWMRKIGGIVVEAKSGAAVVVPKPLQIGVDGQLPEYAVKREPLLFPSTRLLSETVPAEQWQALFVAELRAAYKTNPKAFKRYAEDLESKKIELRCSCDNHGTPHKERCPVPVLETIFKKISTNHNTAL